MKRLVAVCFIVAAAILLSFGAAGCSSLPGNAENVSYWQ